MFVVRDSIRIHAPVERCFLLSTSLELVERELGMHPTAGTWSAPGWRPRPLRTSGMAARGDYIRWQGWQLGLPSTHLSHIRAFYPYRFFQDRMLAGRFRSFQHDHAFLATEDGTLLADEIRFALPYGLAGRVVARFLVAPHVRRLLHRRFRLLQRMAESGEWTRYVSAG